MIKGSCLCGQVQYEYHGTIETDFQCDNKYHIYAESKASWHEITDAAPQFKELN